MANRQPRRKLIHMNVVSCADHGNSADGTKPLRDPLSSAFTSCKQKVGLVPRQNRKKTGSSPEDVSQHLVAPVTESFSDQDFLDDGVEDVMCSMVYDAGTADHNLDCDQLPKPSSSQSMGFVSARQFMNPTYRLAEPDQQKEVPSVAVKVLPRLLPVTSTGKGGKSVNRPVQKNVLDKYFKPVAAPASDSQMSCSQSSPKKSVMNSPIKKLAGSSNIYYCCTNSSQESASGSCSTIAGRADNIPNTFCGMSLIKVESDRDCDFDTTSNTTFRTNQNTKRRISPRLSSSLPHKRSKSAPKSRPRVPKSSETSVTPVTPLCPESEINSGIDPLESAECDLKHNISADKYGMFGFSDRTLIQLDSDTDFDEDVDRVDYFSRLPEEVVANILCRLPFLDMCLNVNRVCLAWRDIIGSETFMPWKKSYHRLLKEDQSEWEAMMKHLKDGGMTSPELYLPNLVRFLKLYKPATAKMLDKPLRKHHNYACAYNLMVERFPDCMIAPQVPTPWCIIVIIVLLAHSVQDISEIFMCLLGCKSECTAEELLECLYCTVSFLHVFKKLKLGDVWTGMHYRLYYALYLYENDSVSTTAGLSEALGHQVGQQSIRKYSCAGSKLRLTHEQLRICNHNIQPGEIIKIVAFAGTGKTTTLLEYARLRPGVKFLLIVYNKSVAEHAKSQFPPNVDCTTAHSLAYRKLGWTFNKKLGSNVRISDILNHIHKRKGENMFVQAKFVVDTLTRFMASADENITTAHVPHKVQNSEGIMVEMDHDRRMKLADDAEMIWKKMSDVNDPNLRLPHDGYLKLWQLRRPRLDEYEVVMIDEAQDLTPAVADIFQRQKMARIMVGDPHQQIYAFRGAVNAMDFINSSRTFYLTQSFRFGPEIAAVAASCLELLKGEKRKILVGSGIEGGIEGDQKGQLAIVARTNFTLFKEAVNKCVYSDSPVKVAFAGGVQSYGFDMVEDIYTLMTDQSPQQKESLIRNPMVKYYIHKGFAEFEKYANATMDGELLGKIKIVRAFGHTLSSHISQILSKCVTDPFMADIVLSTAHKAKGLEFDTVRLTNDYLSEEQPSNQGGIRAELLSARKKMNMDEDEYNLLYVAITRAKKRLQMSPTLIQLLRRVGEDFGRLVPTQQLGKDGVPFVCSMSGEAFEPKNVVTLYRRKVVQSNGSEIHPQVFSPEAVHEHFPSLRHIAGVIAKPQPACKS